MPRARNPKRRSKLNPRGSGPIGFRQMFFDTWRGRGLGEDAVQARWVEYVGARPALAKKYKVTVVRRPQLATVPAPKWDGAAKRKQRRKGK